jgi:hypothetical protein
MAERKYMPVRLLSRHSEVDSGGRRGIQKSPVSSSYEFR